MRKLTLGIVAGALAAFLSGPASAGTLSSSKVAFSQGDLFGLASACVIDGASLVADCEGTGGAEVADTGFVTVMTSFIRTPNNKPWHAAS